jgi:leucyl aminopeptidase
MIEIETGADLTSATGDILAVPVFADREYGPGAGWAAERLGDGLEAYFEERDFTGKDGQTALVPAGDALPFTTVAFVGVGSEPDSERLRRAAAGVARSSGRAATVVTTLHQVAADAAAPVSTGFLLGAYRFDRYRSAAEPAPLARLVLTGDASGADEGAAIAAGVATARDLVNEPAQTLTPQGFVDAAVAAVEPFGVTSEVWDEVRIADEGLGGLAGVGAGSANPPRLLQLRYEPEGAAAFLVLVGKGIVFDSGGLSLKTAAGMETMKTDMGGAAAVVGAIQVIAALELPIRVTAIAPLAENMPSGSAIRPGDVLRPRNGKTIEVMNTDAEGRLVLADGLSLAVEAGPDLIVDLATLTGACKVALGEKIAGLFSNDDAVADLVATAAEQAGERVWRLPLPADYRKLIDSDVADMKNTGSRFGGAIAAALLLQEFAGDGPWAHLDIAGPGRVTESEHYLTMGGSGFGVRTLVEVARAMAAGSGAR